MQSSWEKAIRLAKKTGDRLIIFDSPDSDQAMVLMNLDQYEALAAKEGKNPALTEDEMLDRINRDIAVNRDEHIFNDFRNPEPSSAALENDQEAKKGGPGRSGNLWSIPGKVKQGAEEIIEEDRQYLEEVPF